MNSEWGHSSLKPSVAQTIVKIVGLVVVYWVVVGVLS